MVQTDAIFKKITTYPKLCHYYVSKIKTHPTFYIYSPKKENGNKLPSKFLHSKLNKETCRMTRITQSHSCKKLHFKNITYSCS